MFDRMRVFRWVLVFSMMGLSGCSDPGASVKIEIEKSIAAYCRCVKNDFEDKRHAEKMCAKEFRPSTSKVRAWGKEAGLDKTQVRELQLGAIKDWRTRCKAERAKEEQRKKKHCDFCGMDGHIERNCRTKPIVEKKLKELKEIKELKELK